MKTLILAMAAMMTLGAGAAFAGEGGTAVQAQWARTNGIHNYTEQQFYGYDQAPGAQATQQAPQQTSILLSGSAWNSNG